MKNRERTPYQIEREFMTGKQSIPADNLHELAVILADTDEQVVCVESFLVRDCRKQNLSKYKDKDGVIHYEPKDVRKTRLRVAGKAPKPRFIKGRKPKMVLDGAEV